MRRQLIVIALVLVVAGCGEDDEGGGGSTKGNATPAAVAGKAPGAGLATAQLTPQVHIEDRVACPSPSMAKSCDLAAPTCGKNEYCLATSKGAFCGACPERDAIRHTFKPRDFVAATDIRDPFQSFVLVQPGLDNATDPSLSVDKTERCLRPDQMRATSYAYQELKLVGIVAQGTQRKALMMGGNLGYIIKRGDCVGKEKAIVKDIGAGYITFVMTPDTTASAGAREPEEHSVQLYPTQVSISSLPSEQPMPRTMMTPMVAPPPTIPSPQSGGMKIQIEAPPRARGESAPKSLVPPQAPTELRP